MMSVAMSAAPTAGLVRGASVLPARPCALRPSAAFRATQAAPRRATAAAAAVTEEPVVEEAPAAVLPSDAEVIRTLLDISCTATLSTLTPEGTPLGTSVQFLAGEDGVPVLRLRDCAVHTANLAANPRCSLFVCPADLPARQLGRVTVLGKVAPLDAEATAEASELFQAKFAGALGVDALHPNDSFVRMEIDECFYVAGLGSTGCAATVSSADVSAATADRLKDAAPSLVAHWNSEVKGDVIRLAADCLDLRFADLADAEMLWVDVQGLYIAATPYDGAATVVRYGFPRAALDERDARSLITMGAQLAWERERNYMPPTPPPLPPTDSDEE